MNNLSHDFLKLENFFTLTLKDMEVIAKKFSLAMDNGLKGRKSPLKMLPSFIKKPTGLEKGVFLAVDFGGTNIRTLKAALDGRRGFDVLARISIPLKDPNGSYDYTSQQTKAPQLFDFITKQINEVAGDEKISLGLTFSYPCNQKGLTKAILIKWTKELETSEAEGRDVGQMLNDSLLRAGLKNISLEAIINDTSATLLTAAYLNPGADIASICGTGHNTCYLEDTHPLTNEPMIVNMESGNFDEAPQTIYDLELDRSSEKPSSQLLEKQCGGHYLGEILRLVAEDFFGCRSRPYSLKGEDLALLLSAEPRISYETPALLGFEPADFDKFEFMRKTARLIVRRSARLAAATFAGTLIRLDADLERPHAIAIDGSLYEKMPGYASFIREALGEIFREKAIQITLSSVKNASGIGAAIAAAIACSSENSC